VVKQAAALPDAQYFNNVPEVFCALS